MLTFSFGIEKHRRCHMDQLPGKNSRAASLRLTPIHRSERNSDSATVHGEEVALL
jgi:hypothetical protein